jgi:hypothetical protein
LTTLRAGPNLALGSNAGAKLTTGSDNLDIANAGVVGESGTIRIGSESNQDEAFLAGVYGKTTGGPTQAVVVNNSGRLETAPARPRRRPSGAKTKLWSS